MKIVHESDCEFHCAETLFDWKQLIKFSIGIDWSTHATNVGYKSNPAFNFNSESPSFGSFNQPTNQSKMDFNINRILSIILYFHIQFIGLNSAATADDDVVSFISSQWNRIFDLSTNILFCSVIHLQVMYDIHYDRTESFNGTDQYFKYQGSIVKRDETQNIFTVDAMLELLQDLDNDWQVVPHSI